MKKIFRSLPLILILFRAIAACYGQEEAGWHYPLYLSNLDYWHSRIPVIIKNSSSQDVSGEPLSIKIGSLEGQLKLQGTEAGAIRVIDSEENELLWKIIAPGERVISDGPVPEHSEFLLPATVKANETGIYYIYFDNPGAWPEGAVLEKDPSIRETTFQSVNRSTPEVLKTDIRPTETITLNNPPEDKDWPHDQKWDIRVPVRILNFTNSKLEGAPVYVKMDQVYQRLYKQDCRSALIQLGNRNTVQVSRFADAIVFEKEISPLSDETIYAYFAANRKSNDSNHLQENFPWYYDKRNLVKDPSPGHDTKNWDPLVRSAGLKGSLNNVSKEMDSTGYCLKININKEGEGNKAGWKQDIPVEPGKSYMFGAMARCSGFRREISISIQFLGENGILLNQNAESNKISSSEEWKLLSGFFKAPDDAVSARMNLSVDEAGTASFRGMMMMKVIEGYASSLYFDQREPAKPDHITIWPANPIVKVFREDLPPVNIQPARISAAQNETEPLQIAVRSPWESGNMRVEVTAPTNSSGTRLDKVSVYLVGYVPVDYPSNYYERKVPYWYLKFPTEPPGSDGWAGFWPDPLIPGNTFDLAANKTQPVWIEVNVPQGTRKGDYTGQIRLYRNDSLISVLPWLVHVWDFALPKKNSFGAIYDYRSLDDMPEPGPEQFRTDITEDSLRGMYLTFMGKHRISSGEISPSPKVIYRNGKADIDFKEYDKAASYYFDELKNPYAYLPTGLFYLFGWAFPPSEKFGEKPYPGDYPFDNADRGKLRPGYKKAYQTVLRTFWQHISEKGWSDRYVLYLSDEPHMAENGKADIVAQMKALCDMIHEVDPKIPVYVSTWWYRPEWEGYIDIWGLGFNGEGDYGHAVTKDDLKHIISSGKRIWFTTDGNFCTETPYLALERLLPYFGFKFGADAYEFWGVNWLTYNPFKYGWHSYIFESQAPGEESWKRYPNGDGFVIYPGKPIGKEELIGSIRIKQVRDGAEDYEYLSLLQHLIENADLGNPSVKTAKAALQKALDLIDIPCAMGRYSTWLLKSPDEVITIRENIARSIESFSKK